MYKYIGGIHIHTLFSDGTANVEYISKCAKKAGLDWIIITDHNNNEVKEGFYNGVWVFKGYELSPKTENHYLVIDTDEVLSVNNSIEDNIEAIRNNKGFGFAAHPQESLNRDNKYKPIRWLDKSIIPDGVEIWNWLSQWVDNYCDKNIFFIIFSYLFRDILISTPCLETMIWWDKMNNVNKNIVPAIGGLDLHALNFKKFFISLKIFPYKSSFNTILNMIELEKPLTNDLNKNRFMVFEAIKRGNNTIFYKKRINIKTAYEFTISNLKYKVSVGKSIKLDEKTYLDVKLPKQLKISIRRNGKKVFVTDSCSVHFKLKALGKYRIEVEDRCGYGMIYSNPIIVHN